MELIITNNDFIAKLDGKDIDMCYEVFDQSNGVAIGYFALFYQALMGTKKFTQEQACFITLAKITGVPRYTINGSVNTYSLNSSLSVQQIPDIKMIDKEVKDILKNFKKDDITKIYTYDCRDIGDVIMAGVFHYTMSGCHLKKCPICDKWFITKDKRQNACPRNYEDTTCKKEYIKIYKKQYDKDDLNKLFHNIEVRLTNYGDNDALNEFSNEKNDLRKKYKDNPKSFKEIEKYLKSKYFKGGNKDG